MIDSPRVGAAIPASKWVNLRALQEAGIIEVRSGFAQGTHNSSGAGVPHLRPFNVTTESAISLDQIKSIFPPPSSSPHYLRRGDIIFNNTNSEELVGKTAFFDREGDFVLSNHMTRVRVLDRDVVEARWLAYWLHARWMDGTFRRLCRRHVNQASVGLDRLLNLGIGLAPLSEQRRIAHVLGTIQRAREAADRTVSAAINCKSALIEEGLKDRLTRPIMNLGLRETPFGNVPNRWTDIPLRELAYIQTGLAKGRRYLASDDLVELPYLRVANVQDGALDLREMKTVRIKKAEIFRYSLRNGDVLLTEGGDFDKLGRGFIWHGQVPTVLHQNHVFAVRCGEKLLPEFLAYLVQSRYGKRYFLSVAHRTTHLACINSTKLGAFPVPLPTIDEQADLVTIFAAAERKIRVERSSAVATAKLFGSALAELLGRR